MKNYKEAVNIVKRDNNKKRKFLIVNKMQGKHIPTSPLKAMKIFNDLAKKICIKENEKAIIIGFAETATAIGASVAIYLRLPYINTTREKIDKRNCIIFSEDHSHAVEQKLAKNLINENLDRIDRIVFVEDEITSGQTILNIIEKIEKEYNRSFNYSVASIINTMSKENLKKYEEKNIDLYYLLKLNNDNYDSYLDKFDFDEGNINDISPDISDVEEKNIDEYSEKKYQGCLNTRNLVNSIEYEKLCKEFSKKVIEDVIVDKNIGFNNKNILVIGTEEFMYPAIYLGGEIEKLGFEVFTHSTTRSPILPNTSASYIINERYLLDSFYEEGRKTYIYNLDIYDRVIIVTDSMLDNKNSKNTLVNALIEKGNKKINLVRWCNDENFL